MTGTWEPPPAFAAVLRVDEDGRPSDPGAVIEDARESGRWEELVEPTRALLADEALHPLWRWLACKALCAWADPVGYAAVVQTAATPERAVWADVAQDRFGRDTTFGELAEAVGEAAGLAEERGTQEQRRDALRALLAAAPRVDVVHGEGQGLVDAVRRADAAALEGDVRAAVAAVRRALADDDRIDPVRLAGLVVVLGRADEPAAVREARQLLTEHPTRDVVVWLTGLVAGGRGEESLLLAGELGRVAAQHELQVGTQLDGALAARRRVAGRSQPSA